MSAWQSVRFSTLADAEALTDRLFALPRVSPQIIGAPGAAVFSLYSRDGSMAWYFSPEMGRLGASFGAVDCATPVPAPAKLRSEAFTLLLGDADALNTHFPDYVPLRH